ncbi:MULTISPECIES: hypothetical protein [Glaesserella]|uniref:Uncharacterized protein n=1 Tax=Glaesserella australis TaxID=2094024 RepID=A0A328C1J2_9PAST|nr:MULTISPECIES: hypothetical protein [Glaesserella]AUI65588.1 hypothetical protein CJD39_02890 [Glaesserella sp. 15-184]RAL19785.1 hypothetical protein C5N92_01975 [Glaesserella australis]
MKNNYIKSLISKHKDIQTLEKELEAMKKAYVEEISPYKIGDVIQTNHLDNAEIKIQMMAISNIYDDAIELKFTGYNRNQNGEFGLRLLNCKQRVECKPN